MKSIINGLPQKYQQSSKYHRQKLESYKTFKNNIFYNAKPSPGI
ncbi:MAG: hypothetical protein ACQPRH_04310 [Solitalea-like symbiont of Tyrophagus putrescentiae]